MKTKKTRNGQRYLLLTIATFLGHTTALLAQGTVVYNNSTGLVQQWTSGANPDPIPVAAGNGFVQLAYAPAGAAYTPLQIGQSQTDWLLQNPGWSVGNTSPINVTGKFDGGVVTLTGIAAGADSSYAIFGWTGFDLTFNQALNHAGTFIGLSDPFVTATGGGGAAPVALADSFGGMILRPSNLIPEPSASALIGVGLLILVVLRHRT